jgi:hypothetical protein
MNIIEAIAQATRINEEIAKPNTGNPRINPSRMVKKRAVAIILLNLKDSFLGLRKPIRQLQRPPVKQKILFVLHGIIQFLPTKPSTFQSTYFLKSILL